MAHAESAEAIYALAFTAEQVQALTGLSRHQLTYWARTRFFPPERGTATIPFYSFRDLVGLRVLATLRHEHRVPLQELRKVGRWLRGMHATPWASLRLFVSGRNVYFEEPKTGARLRAGDTEQAHFRAIELKRVAADTTERVQKLRSRSAELQGQVERRRNVSRNAPRVAGTRIPTAAIWSFHDAGYSTRQILQEYPSLTAEDVAGAIAWEQKRPRKQARRSA